MPTSFRAQFPPRGRYWGGRLSCCHAPLVPDSPREAGQPTMGLPFLTAQFPQSLALRGSTTSRVAPFLHCPIPSDPGFKPSSLVASFSHCPIPSEAGIVRWPSLPAVRLPSFTVQSPQRLVRASPASPVTSFPQRPALSQPAVWLPSVTAQFSQSLALRGGPASPVTSFSHRPVP